jgi:uncharacterized protein (TIGR03000 family)
MPVTRFPILWLGTLVCVVTVGVRPIMSQPIGPRGAPLVSAPGFVGPGPARKCAGVETGWSYYGLPSGPTTTIADSRVGVWNWGWAGSPATLVGGWKASRYGPVVPSYTPIPALGGSDARSVFMDPPRFGYGLSALGYRSASPRLATPSVSVQPPPALPSASCCRVDVRMPQADAELWVNRTKTNSGGVERTFETPELGDGKEYRYELVAKWTRNGEVVSDTRGVVVAGGRSVVVDFTAAK